MTIVIPFLGRLHSHCFATFRTVIVLHTRYPSLNGSIAIFVLSISTDDFRTFGWMIILGVASTYLDFIGNFGFSPHTGDNVIIRGLLTVIRHANKHRIEIVIHGWNSAMEI